MCVFEAPNDDGCTRPTARIYGSPSPNVLAPSRSFSLSCSLAPGPLGELLATNLLLNTDDVIKIVPSALRALISDNRNQLRASGEGRKRDGVSGWSSLGYEQL